MIALLSIFTTICMLCGCSVKDEAATIEDIKTAKSILILKENLPVIEELPTKPEVEEAEEQVEKVEEEKEEKKEEKPKNEPEKNTAVAKPNEAGSAPSAPTGKLPYYIKVNREANCVTIYTKDENGQYTVPVKAMVCSVGKRAGSTPAGKFKIYQRYTWRYLLGDQYGQYAVRFNGQILFHSVPYTKQSKDSLKTDYYNRLGEADSMGCVRLTCVDAKWIYDNCANGTIVEVYDSANPGPLGKPAAQKIDPSSPNAGWDPTDPDKSNPWRKQPPTISGVKDVSVNCGTSIEFLEGVTASDSDGNELSVAVSGTVDFNTPGTYNITYNVTDTLGKSTSVSAVVIVLEVVAPEVPEVVEPQVPEVEGPETPEAEVPTVPEASESDGELSSGNI